MFVYVSSTIATFSHLFLMSKLGLYFYPLYSGGHNVSFDSFDSYFKTLGFFLFFFSGNCYGCFRLIEKKIECESENDAGLH